MNVAGSAVTTAYLLPRNAEEFFQPPAHGYSWFQWSDPSNHSSTRSDESIYTPLMKTMVAITNSQTPFKKEIMFPLLLLPNGTLLHSDTVTRSILGKKPKWRSRYPGRILHAEDMIKEAAKLAALHVKDQPRFNALLKSPTPILLQHGDLVGCGDNHVSTTTGGIITDKPIPRFTWCKAVDCQYSWPIPSYNLWEMFAAPMKYGKVMKSPDDWVKQQTKWRNKYPWSAKLRKAIWRGSPTGAMGTGTNKYADLPRVHLVRKAQQQQQDSLLLDAAFTSHVQIDPTQLESFKKEFGISPSRTTMIQQQKYRAIVDIDGNTWSSRFGMQLCLNSVTIKIKPQWIDYFDAELEPWVHYVPANLTNILEVVEHVVSDANQGAMRKIVENANGWCMKKWTRVQMATDMLWLLIFYVELLDQNDPLWRKSWEQRKNTVVYEKSQGLGDMVDVRFRHDEWQSIAKRKRGFWKQGHLVY
eukprot:CAMPEP_0195298532 /NCGR_PEP_ID=MMETSP0707-20130614/23666_1 /TAXON_ID=33640 /ORGANISM="Asterionellopsis glacialis, Strain CCMP134" /LENGTH=470 /DNA_ID=CAMNT_0040360677 /DNA_START=274 /DNA_END=1686 /DNA_ORIENTATION=+